MLSGQPPWKAKNIQNIVQLHMLLSTMKEEPPKIDRELPKILEEFLNVIFKKDPKERPAVAQLLTHLFLSSDDLDDSMGTIGPGGLSLGNRPYRDAEPNSGGSSADLLRLKDSNISPAYEKLDKAGIASNFSAEDTMVNIDNEINLRKLERASASRATTAVAGGRYTSGKHYGEPDSYTDDELAYSDSAGQSHPIVCNRPSSSDCDPLSRDRYYLRITSCRTVVSCFFFF